MLLIIKMQPLTRQRIGVGSDDGSQPARPATHQASGEFIFQQDWHSAQDTSFLT